MKKLVVSLFGALMIVSAPVFGEIKEVLVHADGFYCPFCSGQTVRAIRNLPGVQGTELWLKNGIVKLTMAPNARLDPQAIIGVLGKSSYAYKSIDLIASGDVAKQGDSFVLNVSGNGQTFKLNISDELSIKDYQLLSKGGQNLTISGSYVSEGGQGAINVKAVQI